MLVGYMWEYDVRKLETKQVRGDSEIRARDTHGILIERLSQRQITAADAPR